jgi:hypothetical protein
LRVKPPNDKHIPMASVHWGGEEGDRDVIYLIHAETGKVMAWSDHLDKGGYPALLKAMPDLHTSSK